MSTATQTEFTDLAEDFGQRWNRFWFAPADALPVTGGDGFQTKIDATGLTVYFNCNAGFGGSVCRGTPPAPFNPHLA